MRDPFLGHHAPGFLVMVGPREQQATYARAFSLREAQDYIREAQADGYWRGEVRVGDLVVQTWPEPVIDGPDCTGVPPEDEPAGLAPVRRRRA